MLKLHSKRRLLPPACQTLCETIAHLMNIENELLTSSEVVAWFNASTRELSGQSLKAWATTEMSIEHAGSTETHKNTARPSYTTFDRRTV
mmetsp:Transcript_127749/g.409020  ORF Transcript_127749/g.409020 Transcript_127749/m.409020 type:complete len:90 (-) Transcript_127749:473-742(-)